MTQKEDKNNSKTPSSIKWISRLSRNNPNYSISSKVVTMGYDKGGRNHERAFMNKLKTTEWRRKSRRATNYSHENP